MIFLKGLDQDKVENILISEVRVKVGTSEGEVLTRLVCIEHSVKVRRKKSQMLGSKKRMTREVLTEKGVDLG